MSLNEFYFAYGYILAILSLIGYVSLGLYMSVGNHPNTVKSNVCLSLVTVLLLAFLFIGSYPY